MARPAAAALRWPHRTHPSGLRRPRPERPVGHWPDMPQLETTNPDGGFLVASQTRTLIKSKDTRSREELADLLQALSERIRDGSMSLTQAGDTIDVALPQALRVDIEVTDSRKPGRIKREVEIEMWWQVDDAGQPVEDAKSSGGLTIG